MQVCEYTWRSQRTTLHAILCVWALSSIFCFFSFLSLKLVPGTTHLYLQCWITTTHSHAWLGFVCLFVVLFVLWVLDIKVMSFTNSVISTGLELYALTNDQIKRTYYLGVDLLCKLDRFVSGKIHRRTLPFVLWLLEAIRLSYMVAVSIYICAMKCISVLGN